MQDNAYSFCSQGKFYSCGCSLEKLFVQMFFILLACPSCSIGPSMELGSPTSICNMEIIQNSLQVFHSQSFWMCNNGQWVWRDGYHRHDNGEMDLLKTSLVLSHLQVTFCFLATFLLNLVEHSCSIQKHMCSDIMFEHHMMATWIIIANKPSFIPYQYHRSELHIWQFI